MAVAHTYKVKRRKGVKVKRISKSKPNCVTARLPGDTGDEITVICRTERDLEKFKSEELPSLKGKKAAKKGAKPKKKGGAKKAAKKGGAKKAAKKGAKPKKKGGAKKAAKKKPQSRMQDQVWGDPDV